MRNQRRTFESSQRRHAKPRAQRVDFNSVGTVWKVNAAEHWVPSRFLDFWGNY